MIESCPPLWINKFRTPEDWYKVWGPKFKNDEAWLKEALTELKYIREVGNKAIQEGTLPLVTPTKAQVISLWQDWWTWEHVESVKELEGNITSFIQNNYDLLKWFYSYSLMNAVDYWYYVWDALHLRHDYPMEDRDYEIYFTLMRANHPEYPFREQGGFVPKVNRYRFTRRWAQRATRERKEELLKVLLKDPEMLKEFEQGKFGVPPNNHPLTPGDLFSAYTSMIREQARQKVYNERQREFEKVARIVEEAQRNGQSVEFIKPKG